MHTPEDTPFLFVYGTLMREFDNPWAEMLRTHAVFTSSGSFPGRLYLVDWFPGAVYQPKAEQKVHGEIYRVTDPVFLIPQLDDYEDIHAEPSLYRREIIPISGSDDRIYHCWAYIYNLPADGLPEIPDGRFRRTNF